MCSGCGPLGMGAPGPLHRLLALRGRDDRVVVPVTTWQAYNLWGGYSLYDGPSGDRRSWAVSFDRPYHGVGGMNDFHISVVPIVVRAEMTGEPLSYFANVDLHDDHDLLAGALGYVSTGHDEYWTPSMRTTVETARDAGTNLAFLGANTAYWRVRLDDRPTGPRRLMTGYRHDAAVDPLRDQTPTEATSRFRDAPGAEPENEADRDALRVLPGGRRLRRGLAEVVGLRGDRRTTGTAIPGLVGGESDRVYPDRFAPRPLQLLSHTSFSCRGVTTTTSPSTTPRRPGPASSRPARCAGAVRSSTCATARSAPDPGLRPPGDGQPVPRVRSRSRRTALPRPGQRRGLRPAHRQHGRGELSRLRVSPDSAIMAPMRSHSRPDRASPCPRWLRWRACGGARGVHRRLR